MELAKFNDHCPSCPEETSIPLFDQMVHLHGFPGYAPGGSDRSPLHVPVMVEPKVIEGVAVK